LHGRLLRQFRRSSRKRTRSVGHWRSNHGPFLRSRPSASAAFNGQWRAFIMAGLADPAK
jgi:hypothetical protein